MATASETPPLEQETLGPMVVAVVAADQLAARRIAAGLEGCEPDELRRSDSPAALLADPEPAPDAIVLACDPTTREALAQVRKLRRGFRAARLLVVSSAARGAGVRQALDAGADAFLHDSDVECALAVVAGAALAGYTSVPSELHGRLVKPAFSHREKQVLSLVVTGCGNREIASRLFLSESTVKSHLASAFEKLGVRSRREAAALLLDPDEGLEATVRVALPPAAGRT